MSMISAQIDELRELAGDGSMEWVTGPIRASVLRDAADTIWQLRDDLQRTNAEADKLREELAIREASEQEKVIEYLRQENIDWEDKYRALAAENAKLRELAERAWKAAEMLCKEWDGPCRADGVSIMTPCPMNERDELCVYGLIQRDMRELGVEVD